MALTRHLTAFLAVVFLSSLVPHEADAIFGLFGKGRKRLAPVNVQAERGNELWDEAEEQRARGNLRSAVKLYEKLWEDNPYSGRAPEALFLTGELYVEMKKWRKAFDAYNLTIQRYPQYERFNEVVSKQFDIATQLMEGRNMRYFGIIPYRANERAIAYFEIIARNAPFSDYAPLALMNVALIYKRTKNVPGAVEALDRIINKYPDSLLTADAYLLLAETYAGLVDGPQYDQGATREARSYFEDYMILYPDSPDVAEAESGYDEMSEVLAKSKLLMGEFYYKKRRHYYAAEVMFNEAITAAPDSPSAHQAQTYLAEIEELPPDIRAGLRRERGRFAIFGGGSGRTPQVAEVEQEVAQRRAPAANEQAEDGSQVTRVAIEEDSSAEVEAAEDESRGGLRSVLQFWKRSPKSSNDDN